jgi:RHS repeat-associated protein
LSGAVTAIRENGAASGIGVLATYGYDNYGRRTSVSRGNGTVTTYGYDAASRLNALTQDLAATASDQSLSFSYNAAGQALTRAGSNSGYVWTQPAPATHNSTANGLNQIATLNSANFTYDGRGNLVATASAAYGYDVYNRLTSAGSATLAYDPAGRLYETVGSGVATRFLYDGVDAIAEYNASGTMLRRYVHGPGVDEALVWYEGASTSDRRWLHADRLGSVIAVSNASGAALQLNTYDEYGVPGSSNLGRFQYTGQMWLPEASLYHYKARAYLPALGRFAQSDPILTAGGMNLYAYVGGDPVNWTDPSGLDKEKPVVKSPPIVVTARPKPPWRETMAGMRANNLLARGAQIARINSIVMNECPDCEVDTVVTGQEDEESQCPRDPGLLAYLSTVGMNHASFLNAQSRQSGRIYEAGGVIGAGNIPSSVMFNRSFMNLPAIRAQFEGDNPGRPVLYDWHTHVDPGVNGALYGFSSNDVFTTALTARHNPRFVGSFVVMRDQILYLSGSTALNRVSSGANYGSFPGTRCR